MKVPNPLTAAQAAARVVTELVQGNPVLVSQEVCDARQTVCDGCDRYSDGQCLECSCFVAIKKNLSTEKCPLNRWPE